jgi:3-deoxy-D-manno-octulosonate 8-phosphate phosphatase (KDO 8-P phosphatase)
MTEQEILQRAKTIKLLLLDVDGVLTDGKLYFGNQGEELKAFNILDGHGIKMLQESGVKVGIVTGRESKLVARRANDLGINIVIQASKDKKQSVVKIAAQLNLALNQIAFMGDDYPDLSAMRSVGLALTTANAHAVNIAHAHWCSDKPGGSGAVREACDLLMQAQDTYAKALEKYL